MAYSNESHAIESQWTYPWKNDYYLMSLNTGEVKSIKNNLKYPGSLSSQSRYFTYFDEELEGDPLNWDNYSTPPTDDELHKSCQRSQQQHVAPNTTANNSASEGIIPYYGSSAL